MRVLVACEESQAVTIELRKLGHEAYSCDIEPCSGGHPEWHLQCDVIPLLQISWDMIIAHPPCTYLSNAGARHLYPKGVLNNERYQKGLEAKDFFMKLYNAKCDRIAVENPIPSKIYKLPKYTQIIQPYEHGHPYSKKTCLWLKGLPKLTPTNIVPKDRIDSTKTAGNWFNKGGKDRQKNRAKTFSGIAKAMAKQWASYNVGSDKALEELEEIQKRAQECEKCADKKKSGWNCTYREHLKISLGFNYCPHCGRKLD